MTTTETTGFEFVEHDITCTADIGLTQEEIEESRWGTRGAFEPMPSAGLGFECYGVFEKRFGRSEVIQALKYVCSQWAKSFPNGPRIGIGNISLAGGGEMPPHVSHQQGVDVDLAPVASTEEEIALTWNDAKYSRQRTQQLVNLLHSNPILNIRTILFNDPHITGVESWEGHDNHLHISFFPSGINPELRISDEGNLRLVAPNMQGPRVRKLQEDLVKVGIDIEVDGIFGRDTDAAVRQFQSDRGLEIDGIVGIETQAKLAQFIRENIGIRKGAAITLQNIIDENQFIPFDDLNSGVLVEDEDLCTEIQTILRTNGLLDLVDGLYGPKTREALRRFKASRHLGGGDILGPTTVKALLHAKPGSGVLPDWKGGDKKAAIQAIIKEAHRQGITNKAQIAYILATVQHETNDTFQPVREAYFLGEPTRAENYRQTLRYYPYYGRGYVQLTWDYNYREYSNILGLDLVNNPDLVMNPDLSLFVLIDGMKRGIFTGIKLDDYISSSWLDFHNARRIINGTDKAELIKDYALNWQTNLA